MNLMEIAKKGMYFYPAYKHYGIITNVMCDRCNKTNLKACIGYDSRDLCLKCADTLISMSSQSVNTISTNREYPLTLMAQTAFEDDSSNNRKLGYLTKMMQESIRPQKRTIKTKFVNKNSDIDSDSDSDSDNNMKTYMMQNMFNRKY